jgi:predicted heme/steroid binding protein
VRCRLDNTWVEAMCPNSANTSGVATASEGGCPFQAAGTAAHTLDGTRPAKAQPQQGPSMKCPWRLQYERPPSITDIKLTRRQLRQLNRTWCIADVKKHKFADDAWVAVNGKVYDISEHIMTHPGWDSAAISTVLSIVSHLGMDCTPEFTEIHRPYPVAWRQLQAFYIGDLAQEAGSGCLDG